MINTLISFKLKSISLKPEMKRTSITLLLIGLLLNTFVFSQVGFGVKGGLLQSMPTSQRDSFSGSPMPTLGLSLYLPVKTNFHLITGVKYMPVRLSNKFDASGIRWETLALQIGAEWKPGKMKTAVYGGINTHYVMGYGKNVLSSNTSSGTSFVQGDLNQRIIPALEAGLIFSPRPLIRLGITINQPLLSSAKDRYPLPTMFGFTLEYRINTKQIKEIRKDTVNAEKTFGRNLRAGTLYFIEDRSDSSHQLFRDSLKKYYTFSKINFIAGNELVKKLNEFAVSPDSSLIFIAKIGSIVYSPNRPSTYGLIVYNYKMQNPVPESPFYIRNLTYDDNFEDPYVVRKTIKTLNARLYRMNRLY